VKRRAWFVVAVSMLAALAACGLPKDGSPRAISPDKVPYGLLGPSSTARGNEPGGETFTLYFLNGDRLQATSRRLVSPRIDDVLTALIAGPAKDDPSTLKSAVPTETRVVRTELNNRVLTIVLSKEILGPQGPVQESAFAQLVYTATDLDGVNQVQFRVVGADGNETAATPQTDSGAKDGPLTRADYTSLAPA
jgi:hypothetical protein